MPRPKHTFLIIEMLKAKKIDPDALTIHEKRLIVQFLRLESNQTYNKIAEFLKTPLRTVKRYATAVRTSAMAVFPLLETERYARYLIGEMEELKERARAQNDNWLELAIITKRTQMLGRMGMIEFKAEFQAPQTGGDIVFGDKVEVNKQQIARQMVMQLTDEQRTKLSAALRETGLVKPDEELDE